jgi:DNA-directed RNA polymerase subunit K/omega
MAELDDAPDAPPDAETSQDISHPKAAPIESRFLYVDVASMRAKQLRRGALPRIDEDDLGEHRTMPHKAERIAMEEVKRGLVLYEVPGGPRLAEGQ